MSEHQPTINEATASGAFAKFEGLSYNAAAIDDPDARRAYAQAYAEAYSHAQLMAITPNKGRQP